MKKWKVVKGGGNIFKNAPEWCTQISSDEDGTRCYYEEAFGVIGAKFQNMREGAVWCLNNKDTFNDGLVVIAERVLIEEKGTSPKRVKGPKQPKKTSNKVVVNYNTGETYTIKGVASVSLEDNSFQVFKEYKPFLKALEERKLTTDADKFNLVMSLIGGDTEAIKKVLKDKNIDPLELDLDDIRYTAKNVLPSKAQMLIEETYEQADNLGIADKFSIVI